MAEKLHVRLKKNNLNRLRAYALLVGETLESVVTAAIMEWVNSDSWFSATEIRADVILPVTKDGMNYLKDTAEQRGMRQTAAVDQAIEAFLASHFREPATDNRVVAPQNPGVAIPNSETEPDRECHCTACGHAWTPKGKGQPAYCPKCRSKEWDKVVVCETDCGRPIAPMNTKAGSSTMCEPCYTEMNANWGGEPNE
jgi:hypothetical protein